MNRRSSSRRARDFSAKSKARAKEREAAEAAKLAAMDPEKREAYLKYKAELEGMSGRKMDKLKDDMGKSMSSPGPAGARAVQRLIGAVKGMKAFKASASAAPKSGGLAPSMASAAGDALKKAAAKAKPKPGAPPPAAAGEGGSPASPAPPAVGSKKPHSVPAGQPPPPGTPPGKTVPAGQPPPPGTPPGKTGPAGQAPPPGVPPSKGKAPPPKAGKPPPSVGSRQGKPPPPIAGKAPPKKKTTAPAKIIVSASGERMLVLPDGRVVPLGTAVAAAAAGGVDLSTDGGEMNEDAVAKDRSALDKLASYVTKRMATAASMAGKGGSAATKPGEGPSESSIAALKAGVSSNVIKSLLKNCEERKEGGWRVGVGGLPSGLPHEVSAMGSTLPDSDDTQATAAALADEAAANAPQCVLGTAKLARGRGIVYLLRATDGLVVVTVESKSQAVTAVGGLITASEGGHIIITNDQAAYEAAGVTGTLKLEDGSIVLDASDALLDSLLLDIPEENDEDAPGKAEEGGGAAATEGGGAGRSKTAASKKVAPKFKAAPSVFVLPHRGEVTPLDPGSSPPPNSSALDARGLFGGSQAALDVACATAVDVFLSTGDAGIAAAAAVAQAQDAIASSGGDDSLHSAAEDVLAAVLGGLPPAPSHFSPEATKKHTAALLNAALRKLKVHVPSAPPSHKEGGKGGAVAAGKSDRSDVSQRTSPHDPTGSDGEEDGTDSSRARRRNSSAGSDVLDVTVSATASAVQALGGEEAARHALDIAEKVLKSTGSKAAAKAAAKKAWVASRAAKGVKGGLHDESNAMAALDAVFDAAAKNEDEHGPSSGALAAALGSAKVDVKSTVRLAAQDEDGGDGKSAPPGQDGKGGVLVADDSDSDDDTSSTGDVSVQTKKSVPTASASSAKRVTDTLLNMLGGEQSAADAAAKTAAQVLAATGSLDAAAAAGVAAAREALGGDGSRVAKGAESALRRLLRALPDAPEALSAQGKADFYRQVLAGSMARVQVSVKSSAGAGKQPSGGLKLAAPPGVHADSHDRDQATTPRASDGTEADGRPAEGEGNAAQQGAAAEYKPQRRGSATVITVDRTAKLVELFGGDDEVMRASLDTAAQVLAATGSEEAAVAAGMQTARRAAKERGVADALSAGLEAQLRSLVQEAAGAKASAKGEAGGAQDPTGQMDAAQLAAGMEAAARKRTVRVQAEVKLRDLTAKGVEGGHAGSDDDEFDVLQEAGTSRSSGETSSANKNVAPPETVPCVFLDLVSKDENAADTAVAAACKVLAATGSLDAAAAAGVAAAREALGGDGSRVAKGAESALRRLLRALPDAPDGLSPDEVRQYQHKMLRAAARMTKLNMPREGLKQNIDRLPTTQQSLQDEQGSINGSKPLVFRPDGSSVHAADEQTSANAVVAKAIKFTRNLPLWSLFAPDQDKASAIQQAALKAAAVVRAATASDAMAAAAAWTAARREAVKQGVPLDTMSNRTEQELFRLINRTAASVASDQQSDPVAFEAALTSAARTAHVKESVVGYIPESLNREHRVQFGQAAVRPVEYDVAPSIAGSDRDDAEQEHTTVFRMLQHAGADVDALQRLVATAAQVLARTGSAPAAAAAAAEAALPCAGGLDSSPSKEQEILAVAIARLLPFFPAPAGTHPTGVAWDQFRFFLEEALTGSQVEVPKNQSTAAAGQDDVLSTDNEQLDHDAKRGTIRVPIERTTSVLRLLGGHDDVLGALLDTSAQVLAVTNTNAAAAVSAALAAARSASRARNAAQPLQTPAVVPRAARDAFKQVMRHVLTASKDEADEAAAAADSPIAAAAACEDVWWTALAEAVATLGVRVPDEAVLPLHVRAVEDEHNQNPEDEQEHLLRDMFCLHDGVVGAAQAAAQRALSSGASGDQAAALAIQAAKAAAFELDLDNGVPDSAQYALRCVLESLPPPPADLQSGEPRAFYFGQVVAAAMQSTWVTVGRTRLQQQQARFIADTRARSDVIPPSLLPEGVHVTAGGMLVYTANGAPLDTDAAAWVWNEILYKIAVLGAEGGAGGELYALLKSGRPLQPAVAGDAATGGMRGFERSVKGLTRHDYLKQAGNCQGSSLAPLVIAEAPLYRAILTPDGVVDRTAVDQVQRAAVTYIQEGKQSGGAEAQHTRFDVWRTVHKVARSMTQHKSMDNAWVKAVVSRGEGGVYTVVEGSSTTKSDAPQAGERATWSRDASSRRPATESDSPATLAGAMRGIKWAASASHAEIALLSLSHWSAGKALAENYLHDQAVAVASAWKNPLPPLPPQSDPPSHALTLRRGVDAWRVSSTGGSSQAGRHRLLHPPQPTRRNVTALGVSSSPAPRRRAEQGTVITVSAFKGASTKWRGELSHSEQVSHDTEQSQQPSLTSRVQSNPRLPSLDGDPPRTPLVRHRVHGRGELDMTSVDRHHPLNRSRDSGNTRLALLAPSRFDPKPCGFPTAAASDGASSTPTRPTAQSSSTPATMRVTATQRTLSRMEVSVSDAMSNEHLRDVFLEHNTRDQVQRLVFERSLRRQPQPHSPPPGVSGPPKAPLDLDDELQLHDAQPSSVHESVSLSTLDLQSGGEQASSGRRAVTLEPQSEGVHPHSPPRAPKAHLSLSWTEYEADNAPPPEQEEPLDGQYCKSPIMASVSSPPSHSIDQVSPLRATTSPPLPSPAAGARTLSEADSPSKRSAQVGESLSPRGHTPPSDVNPPQTPQRRASEPALPSKRQATSFKVYLPSPAPSPRAPPSKASRGGIPALRASSPILHIPSQTSDWETRSTSLVSPPSPHPSRKSPTHHHHDGSATPRADGSWPSIRQAAPSAHRKVLSPRFANFKKRTHGSPPSALHYTAMDTAPPRLSSASQGGASRSSPGGVADMLLPPPPSVQSDRPLIVAPLRVPAHLPPAPPLHTPDRPQHVSQFRLPGEARQQLWSTSPIRGATAAAAHPRTSRQPWDNATRNKTQDQHGSHLRFSGAHLATSISPSQLQAAAASPPPPPPPDQPVRVDTLPAPYMPQLQSRVPASSDTVRATARLAEAAAARQAQQRLAAESAIKARQNAQAATDGSIRRHVRKLLEERKAAVRRVHGLPPPGGDDDDDVRSTISAWWEPSGGSLGKSAGATSTAEPPRRVLPSAFDGQDVYVLSPAGSRGTHQQDSSFTMSTSRSSAIDVEQSGSRSAVPDASLAHDMAPIQPSTSAASSGAVLAAAFAAEGSPPPPEPGAPPPAMTQHNTQSSSMALDFSPLQQRIDAQATAAQVKAAVLPGVFGSTAASPDTIRRELVRGSAADAERAEATRRRDARARGGVLRSGLSWEARLAAGAAAAGNRGTAGATLQGSTASRPGRDREDSYSPRPRANR